MKPSEPQQQPPADERLQEALAACIDAWHSGGPTEAQRVAVGHGDLAPVLQQRLEKLHRAGLLPDGGGDVPDEPVSEPAVPAMLGEFRLGRRIGAGGMGVVHLAEQMSLGRVVALKLVRPEMRFFPGAPPGSGARSRRSLDSVMPASFRSTVSARTRASTTSRWSTCAGRRSAT